MVKVFWLFPSPENLEQWKRLAPEVQEYVRWLHYPKKQLLTNHSEYSKETSNFPDTTLTLRQVQSASVLQEFAEEYNERNKVDLNEVLTTWVDLKYEEIWSHEFLKKKKQEIKDNNTYFRMVKQGSQLVYVCFHIFTIFVVMLSATMRQSVISLGYVFILLPFIKDGADVLMQRNIHQNENRDKLESQVESMQQELRQGAATLSGNERAQLEERLREARAKLVAANQTRKKAGLSFTQKREESKKTEKKDWGMIKVVSVYLLIYGIIDFTVQIIGQLPFFEVRGDLSAALGFRKIWAWDPATHSAEMVFSYSHFVSRITESTPCVGLQLQRLNLGLQILNCIIIATITLQAEIFQSAGYLKYVKQTDGSMDLLVQLSELKAKSITYVFNNTKIRKIISIQRKKEVINSTVQKIREKLIRWRKFSKTTLVNSDPSTLAALREDLQRMNEENKKELLALSTTEAGATKNTDDGLADHLNENEELAAPETPERKAVRFPDHQDGEDEETRSRPVKISVEESAALQRRLANEFVAAKLKKMRTIVSLYIWLNETFTTQIMFKNNRKELEAILQQHAAGEVAVQTELEKIMTTEALEFIKHHYDHTGGKKELSLLLAKSRGKGNILQITGFHRLIKLKDMKKTWEFTRTVPMMIRLVETFFYIIISQTQNIIYLAMIMSMFQNAGIISLIYPISVFGYALLEETRPRREFWIFIRQYTTVVLFFKFVMNLQFFDPILESETFTFYASLLKIGIYEYGNMYQLFLYMIPEVLIICFIMLNEIKLRLLGLYFEIEEDIEGVLQGIDRNLEKGDEEKVKQKKLQSSHMCMKNFFVSTKEQMFIRRDGVEAVKAQIKEEINEQLKQANIIKTKEDIKRNVDELYKARFPEESRRDRQMRAVKDLSRGIWDQANNFDLDTTKKESDFDRMVYENVIQKCLEDDNLIFVEGQRKTSQPDFITRKEFQEEVEKVENWDTISAGDYEEEFGEMFEEIEKRTRPKLGIFEKRAYFDKLFPALKIQKPGYDLYGTSTTVLAFLALFVFMFYQHLTVDSSIFKFLIGQSSLFGGEMAMVVLAIIAVILLERYTNRTDTKAEVAKKRLTTTNNLDEASQGFFSQDEMFQRASTARSMTVKLKTLKTSDLDMQGNAAQDFLKQMYGEEASGKGIEGTRTKITTQQKTKYVLHMVLVIGCHLFVFWYLPIHGNYLLYGQPQCDPAQEKYYSCKNFQKNGYLRFFYVLICLYLTLSALQLKYGFPIMKKPSSVLQYYGDLPNIGSLIYTAIPFAIELRCVFDFTLSKTSLDNFQYWQLFQYHLEIYNAKNGNRYYGEKRLGQATARCDKCLFGVTITGILIFLLVGPFLIFSEYGGLTAPNPVLNGEMQVSLLVEKAVYTHELTGRMLPGLSAKEAREIQKKIDAGTYASATKVASSVPYLIYENKNAFLRTFDEAYWRKSPFSEWTETRTFKPSQVQECMFAESPDDKWVISGTRAAELLRDVSKAVNTPAPNLIANVSLALDFKFTRELPSTAKIAGGRIEKRLNYSMKYDCETGQQLATLTKLDCASTPRNPDGSYVNQTVRFSRVFIPNNVLGQTENFTAVDRQTLWPDDQKHDVQLNYNCYSGWSVLAMNKPTAISEEDYKYHTVDPETCEPLYTKPLTSPGTVKTAALDSGAASQGTTPSDKPEKEEEQPMWTRLTLTLFSVLVSGSLLAAYSPTTFYASIVYVASTTLRPIFIFGTWRGWIYETTNPDPIIKLIECCYMRRHEEDLVGEEEAYRMLQEIVRSPELFKALTGSSLKGPTDPALDKLSDKEKRKLEHLSLLEEKGFDVKELKDAMTGRLGITAGENFTEMD